jgi:hypothetical protein
MKLFVMCRISMGLLVFGAALVLAPSSRAQSEIAPDQFDGNDSWAAAAVSKAPTPKTKLPSTAIQAQNKRAGTHAVASNVSEPQGAELVAIQDKRKTSPRKPNQQ